MAETSSMTSSTYEATKARELTHGQADQIHWDGASAFRDSPYRQLHHQSGCIGVFHVRLIEAKDLQRSYWSALALGPVKHLGFSKAHGEVSSSCSLGLSFEDITDIEDDDDKQEDVAMAGFMNKKPRARRTRQEQCGLQTSPVISSNNNPVWDDCQFELPLLKGAMHTDGMRIALNCRIDEDATTVEQFVPGIPGTGGDERMLGQGLIDVTELCLGETRQGTILPSVKDCWVPISLPQQDQCHEDNDNSCEKEKKICKSSGADPLKQAPMSSSIGERRLDKITGRVHLLVSYKPAGLEPQPRDIVALEAFARRNPVTQSFRPLIPPLQPLTILERRGSYLLCEYAMHDQRKACVRLHRNAVFVIERQSLVDAGVNLALLPADFIASTPIGQALAPAARASKELLMPAWLSLKLLWMAVRTTGLAGLSGATAIGQTILSEGSQALTRDGLSSGSNRPRPPPPAAMATGQFVQL